MSETIKESRREGSLEAPIRHPIDWKSDKYYDEADLFVELERVYDICHGCRRCFNLCNAFPSLFDLIDESDEMELEGVAKEKYWDVVDHCYLCDLCYMTKCPYVPPHEWNVDFPHLMLRAKAVKHQKGKTKWQEKVLSATDTCGSLAGIPLVVNVVNAVNKSSVGRAALDTVLGVHQDAIIPPYHSNTARKRLAKPAQNLQLAHTSEKQAGAAGPTTGKVAIFTTCYGNYSSPEMVDDMRAVLLHNGIEVTGVNEERCCGMPKLELGDLEAVAKAKEVNIPALKKMIDKGYDIIAPIPSCVLMFKQELPLMFPDDPDVIAVRDATYDPFEYLMLRHKYEKLDVNFEHTLGSISYHVACHQRVQNVGLKTREVLNLVPDTQVDAIERCSGHDGTYAVKKQFHDVAVKIARPVAKRINDKNPDHFTSDCIMAGNHVAKVAGGDSRQAVHPVTLLRKAYGI